MTGGLPPPPDGFVLDASNAGGAPPPPPPPGFTLDDQPAPVTRPGMLSRAYDWAKDQVTGASRREFDLPDLIDSRDPAVTGLSLNNLRLGAAHLVTEDPKALAGLIGQRLPGAQMSEDRFGNPIVSLNGQRYYVNSPGLSGADAMRFVGNTVAMLPAGRLAGIGGIAGAGLSGAAAGAGSLAEDAASQALGTEQNADLGRAALSAAFSGGASLVAPYLDRAANWLANVVRGRTNLVTAQGTLTPVGEEAARRAGLDPQQMTADMARDFAEQAQRAANPGQAAAVAQASSLPVPVRLTQGQVTGAPGQQMFENLAEKGAYGDAASTYLRGIRGDQQQQLAANIPAIQGRIAGGTPQVGAPGQGATAAQTRLGEMADAGRTGVNAAYDAARGASASVPANEVRGRIGPILDDVRANHALTGLTRTTAILDDLTDIATKNNGITPVRALFDWRQRATAARAAGGEEALAIGRAIRGVDEMLDEIASNALLTGDATAIDLFRTALRTNREFAARFKGGDVIERLVAREPRGGVMQLTVPPEQAANVIFGANRLFGTGNTVRDLVRLRDVLGADSPQWGALREEAWLRLARSAQGAINPLTGEAQVSGANFARALNSALNDNAGVLHTMFSREELALIRQFRDVSTRVTMPVRGGDNFSNTIPGGANMVQRLMSTIFTSESAASRFMAIPIVRQLYGMTAGVAAPAVVAPRLAAPASAGAAGRYLAAPTASGLSGGEARE